MEFIDSIITRDIWEIAGYGARYHTIYRGSPDMIIDLMPDANYMIEVKAIVRDRGLYGTCVVAGIAGSLIDHPDETIELVSQEGTLSLTATYNDSMSILTISPIDDSVDEVLYGLDMVMAAPTGPTEGGIDRANPWKREYEKGVIRR